MLKDFSLQFVVAIALYAIIFALGSIMFFMPAVANGLAGDPVFGFTLVVFLLPLVLLLYYIYYSKHNEVADHQRIFFFLFVFLTLIDTLIWALLILPVA